MLIFVLFQINYTASPRSGSEDETEEKESPLHIPDLPPSLDILNSEFLLQDPTLDPQRQLPPRAITIPNPMEIPSSTRRRSVIQELKEQPRRATWIGRAVLTNNGSEPNLVTPPIQKKGFDALEGVDENHGFKCAVDEMQRTLQLHQGLVSKGFARFPTFEALHQTFAQNLANDVFGGELKSYQKRAFAPIAPKEVGLVDVANIGSS